jgi:hypothetical protein
MEVLAAMLGLALIAGFLLLVERTQSRQTTLRIAPAHAGRHRRPWGRR